MSENLNHSHRLVTYGTLAPGQVNHHQLSALQGNWFRGVVRGRLLDRGWGAAHGCPGMVLDENGDEIDVHIFESLELPDHWPRLDEFEGDEYQRVVVTVKTEMGEISGFIYELATGES